jgi:ribosomal RNA assembly protein
MQSVYITKERLKRLRESGSMILKVESLCKCKIKMDPEDDIIEISGDAYAEYTARNIIYAYGRGFEMEIACKLFDMDYYFSSIDLDHMISSDKRIKQVKARIIGESGRTKTYIESVSGAKISVYGNTVSFIGRIGEINEAETAVNTLIDGGTHRLAYARMEAAHRRNKAELKAAKF